MKVARAAAVVGVLMIPSVGFALPAYLKLFQGTYRVPAGSALAKARCATCHVGTSTKLNPYGKDLQGALKAQKAHGLSPVVFRSVENLDSDKDGKKNIDEIKKGTLPGDPKSK